VEADGVEEVGVRTFEDGEEQCERRHGHLVIAEPGPEPELRLVLVLLCALERVRPALVLLDDSQAREPCPRPLVLLAHLLPPC